MGYKNLAIDMMDEFSKELVLKQILKDRPSAIVHAVEKLRKEHNQPTELERRVLAWAPDQKIQAIKDYMNVTRAGLKEAKETVERIWDKYCVGA